MWGHTGDPVHICVEELGGGSRLAVTQDLAEACKIHDMTAAIHTCYDLMPSVVTSQIPRRERGQHIAMGRIKWGLGVCMLFG